jgi:hypothetical protein
VLVLNPDGTGSAGGPIDSYTPTNFAALQSGDTDLGSTAPAMLPVPPSSKVSHLAIQVGKDGLLRLLNLDNLSGQGGPGHTGGSLGTDLPVPQGGEVLASPAVWVNPADASTWLFVATYNGVAGLKLIVDSGGNPSLSSVWIYQSGASSPLVANGVLYIASSGTVRALAPTTGTLLWSSTIGNIHWESPVVANATLYISDESGFLNAFALPGTAPVPALPRVDAGLLGAVLWIVALRGLSRRMRITAPPRVPSR